jgi:hypothetical protein
MVLKSVGRAQAMQYYAVECQLVQFDHQDGSNGFKPLNLLSGSFLYTYPKKMNFKTGKKSHRTT